jgi:hypothetical protein
MLWKGHCPLEEFGDLKRAPRLQGDAVDAQALCLRRSTASRCRQLWRALFRLPRASSSSLPEFVATVSQFSADTERERRSAAAVTCALSDIYEVITEELGDETQ